MNIKLSPIRRDDTLVVVKASNVLTTNGEVFDFTPMGGGDTLPRDAIASTWFAGDVNNEAGELTLTLTLPNPRNYSQEQAFPADMVNVPDGLVVFPRPLPDEDGNYPDIPAYDGPTSIGVIDWNQLVTKANKDAAALAAALAAATLSLNAYTRLATAQVSALQGRVDAINDATDGGYVLPEETAELPGRVVQLAAWKKYRVLLGRVATQATWPSAPVWPDQPETYTDEMSAVTAAGDS